MTAVRRAGVSRKVLAVSARGGGVTRRVGNAFIRTGAGLKAWFSSLTATVDQAEVTGYGNSNSGVPVQTDLASASPVGGIAPFTYLWTRTGPLGPGWTIFTGTTAQASFECANVNPGERQRTEFTCTITDASGSTASVVVSAVCLNLNAS